MSYVTQHVQPDAMRFSQLSATEPGTFHLSSNPATERPDQTCTGGWGCQVFAGFGFLCDHKFSLSYSKAC